MKIHEIIREATTNEAGGKLAADYLIHHGGKGLKYLGKKIMPNLVGKSAKYGSSALKFARAGEKILALLKYLGLGSIIYDYYSAVEQGEANVKSGKWTEEQFQDFRQGEMTKLVLAIGASTVFFTAIKIFSGFSIWTRVLKAVPSPAINALGSTLNGLSEAVRVSFIAFLISPKGKQAREDIGDLIGRGIIDNTLGGNGVALVDKVQHWIDPKHRDGTFKSPLDPGPTAEPETDKVDPTKDTQTPASTSTVGKADDSSDYAYDKSKFTRNAQGAIVPKITIGN